MPVKTMDLVGIEQARSSSGGGSTVKGSRGDSSNKMSENRIQHDSTNSFKMAVKVMLMNIFVCALVLGYALLGSFVFLELEANSNGQDSSGNKNSGESSNVPVLHSRTTSNLTLAILKTLQGEETQQMKVDTVRNIWDITLSMNILYPDNWTKMTNDEISKFQRRLVDRVLSLVQNATVHEPPVYRWNFPRAFLFALTTLTTIGYGGMGPISSSGKLATMIYAIFGIPIMLWYLSNVGSLLAKIARFLCRKLCCCCGRSRTSCRGDPASPSNSETENSKQSNNGDEHLYQHKNSGKKSNVQNHLRNQHNHNNQSVSIFIIFLTCLSVLIGYVCLGSYIVYHWEGWTFLDSFYFCFLTLTTISFGDYRSQRLSWLGYFSPKTEWFCAFYILFGMALTSMFFNVLYEEVSSRLKRWKAPSPNGGNSSTSTGAITTSDHQTMISATGQLSTPGNTLGKPMITDAANSSSYSVHFMNFPPHDDAAGSDPRSFCNDPVHDLPKGTYDYDESRIEYGVPPNRDFYNNSHPVFPR